MKLMHHAFKHKSDEGVNISYDNFSIDIIVRNIFGPASARGAVIELRGTLENREIYLASSDLITLEHNIQFELSKRRKISGRRIEIHYMIPEDYNVERRKYEPLIIN